MAKAKRKPRGEMPEMIPDTPQNVARAILRTRPPKCGWKYLKERNSKKAE